MRKSNSFGRILFHCVNGIGLGHLVRQVEIAKSLRRDYQGIHITFATSAEEHQWLNTARFPYYYMPSEPQYRYTWQVRENEIGPEVLKKSSPVGLNTALFKTIIDFNKPMVVVFDTYFPDEIVNICNSRHIRPVVFFDTYDAFEIHRERIDTIISANGVILIGADSEYHWKPNDTNWFSVGRILRTVDKRRVQRLSPERRYTDSLKIVCLQGGGGFNEENSRFYQNHMSFFCVVTKALNSVQNMTKKTLHLDFILGPYGVWPNIPVPKYASIKQFEPDLLPFLSTCDFMIARGGYNAVCDSIVAGCPAIFLPIHELTENQNTHSIDLVEKGAAFVSSHNPAELSSLILKLVNNPQEIEKMSSKLVGFRKMSNGADKAATIIKGLFDDNPRT